MKDALYLFEDVILVLTFQLAFKLLPIMLRFYYIVLRWLSCRSCILRASFFRFGIILMMRI